MPLLKGRFVTPIKPLNNLDPKETVYTIPHTKEQFRSKDEYERRLALYNDRVWTCQCTGQIHLTHKEALESEQKVHKILEEHFPDVYQKPVLEVVHHSTDVLDMLTDQAWKKIHTELSVGEKVTLKVKNCQKSIEGTVVKIDKSEQNAGADGSNCSSPSSNKENASDEEKNLKDDSPKKYSPHKLLPYKYSFKMDNEDKIISGVPSEDLIRPHRPPSKEYVKMFIRASAVRGGYTFNSPWLVDEDYVKKYNLPSKFADFFVSPTKMAELGRKALEDASKKKRKHVSGSSHKSTPPTKKPRLSNSQIKSKVTEKIASSPKKKVNNSQNKVGNSKKISSSPAKLAVNGKNVIQVDSDSDSDDEPLKNVIKSPSKHDRTSTHQTTVCVDTDSSSDDDEPLAKLSPDKNCSSFKGTPSSAFINSVNISSSDDDKPLIKSASPAKADRPKKANSAKSPGKVGRPRKSDSLKSPTKSKRGNDDSDEETLASISRKEKKVAGGEPKKRGRPKKEDSKLKQMTLFDMKKPKRGRPLGSTKSPSKAGSPSKSQTPKKTSDSPKKYRMPPVAAKLRKVLEKKLGNQIRNKRLNECATLLKLHQIEQLPDDLREMVQARFDAIQERKKRAKMSPTELAEYLKKRRLEKRRKENNTNPNRKCEDLELDLKPIPNPKLVPTPDGLTNEIFGDVAMVIEFMNCFKGLLMPEEAVISAEKLLTALSLGPDGFTYLGRILGVLLQTLLQDEIAEDYRELSVALRDIPVKSHTVSELVRLCLRKQDVIREVNDPSDEDPAEDEVPEELIERLETVELFSLQPEEKVSLLQGLCHRIMNSYSVQDYIDEKQQTASDMWRQRVACQRDAKTLKKKTKSSPSAELSAPEVKKEENDKKGMTISDFYGQSSENNEEDLATIVKRRRVMAAKAAEEKREKETQRKIQQQKEFEENKLIREREQVEEKFQESVLTARMVLRLAPIGVDRNHNRYWVFRQNTCPCLYVEKGWAPPEINYCVRGDDAYSSSSEEEEEPQGQGRPTRSNCEKTVPHVGQNLWFVYDNVKDLDALLSGLHPNGVREHALKTELQKHYPALVKTLQERAVGENDADFCNGEDELVEAFREELSDMEVRLRNGGLGGVPDFNPWEERLKKATTITACGESLIETQTYIPEKFLKGMMVKKAKKPKVKGEEEEVKGDDSKTTEEVGEVLIGVLQWIEAVRSCPTFSRLHVLMGILDSCVKWEKSAENVKCKICRKKSNDEHLLLCDECNQPFHLFCLRPALYTVPDGEWFCPACNPTRRRTRVTHNYAQLADESDKYSVSSGSDDSGLSDVEDSQDKVCARCGGDEGLVFCSSCPSAFHLECHDPPLRHEPRSSTWRCMQCKTGVRLRKSTRPAPKKRRLYESDDDYNTMPLSKRLSLRNRRASPDTCAPRRKRAAAPKYTLDDYLVTSTGRQTRRSREAAINAEYSGEIEVVERSPEERRTSGRSMKQVSQAEKDKKAMQDVLSRLRRNKNGWPFNEPVDPKIVPDYSDIVRSPMDLQTIEDKLVSEVYAGPQAFINDVALIFDNCQLYNKADSVVGRCLPPLEKLFKDYIQRHFPLTTYSRDPSLNVITLASSEEDDEDELSDSDDEDSSSSESSDSDASSSEDEFSSSQDNDHSYYNSVPGR